MRFLYNFTKFVDWPPDAWSASGGPITVCVLGPSPPGNALAQVGEWKTLRGQPLCRHRIQASGTAASCRIRFTGDSESRHILTIRDAVRGRAVLTIGECPRVADQGVVINLKIDGDVRIEIDQAAADEQALTISSEMRAGGASYGNSMRRVSRYRNLSVKRKLVLIIMATVGAALTLALGANLVFADFVLRSDIMTDLEILAEVVGSNSAALLTVQ